MKSLFLSLSLISLSFSLVTPSLCVGPQSEHPIKDLGTATLNFGKALGMASFASIKYLLLSPAPIAGGLTGALFKLQYQQLSTQEQSSVRSLLESSSSLKCLKTPRSRAAIVGMAIGTAMQVTYDGLGNLKERFSTPSSTDFTKKSSK